MKRLTFDEFSCGINRQLSTFAKTTTNFVRCFWQYRHPNTFFAMVAFSRILVQLPRKPLLWRTIFQCMVSGPVFFLRKWRPLRKVCWTVRMLKSERFLGLLLLSWVGISDSGAQVSLFTVWQCEVCGAGWWTDVGGGVSEHFNFTHDSAWFAYFPCVCLF